MRSEVYSRLVFLCVCHTASVLDHTLLLHTCYGEIYGDSAREENERF